MLTLQHLSVCVVLSFLFLSFNLEDVSVAGATTTQPSVADNTTVHLNNQRFPVAKWNYEFVSTYLLVATWVLFVALGKIAFHKVKWLDENFPESVAMILAGVILGIILYFGKAPNYQLDPPLFFNVILPPIIFDAGYYMPVRSFFDNLGTIVLYAVVGTLINALMIGFALWGCSFGDAFGLGPSETPMSLLNLLVFASLLAAVDPVAVLAVFESVHVNEVLYICVFGESLLNDGIAVALYQIFDGFSSIGAPYIEGVDIVCGVVSFCLICIVAPAIGIAIGLLGGFITRFTGHIRVLEPLIIFVLGYISYLMGNIFHLSGILACTFCGITLRKYCEGRISNKSVVSVKVIIKVMASICEAIVFMYIGIACVNLELLWNTVFHLLTLAFCLVFRSVGVVLQTVVANLFRNQPFNAVDQVVLSYGGLRGGIAFALSFDLDASYIPDRRIFMTATLLVIYFTNLVMGSTIKAVVIFLKVKRQDELYISMSGKVTERLADHTMAGIECIVDQSGYNRQRIKFSKWNNSFLKPLIIGTKVPARHKGHEINQVFLTLAHKDARRTVKGSSGAATEITRYQNVIKRQDSTGDLTRSETLPNLFKASIWGLPEFDASDDRHRQHRAEKELSGDVLVDSYKKMLEEDDSESRPGSYAESQTQQPRYRKRAANNSSSTAALNDNDVYGNQYEGDEYEGKYNPAYNNNNNNNSAWKDGEAHGILFSVGSEKSRDHDVIDIHPDGYQGSGGVVNPAFQYDRPDNSATPSVSGSSWNSEENAEAARAADKYQRDHGGVGMQDLGRRGGDDGGRGHVEVKL